MKKNEAKLKISYPKYEIDRKNTQIRNLKHRLRQSYTKTEVNRKNQKIKSLKKRLKKYE